MSKKTVRYINVVFNNNQNEKIYTYKTTLKFKAGDTALVSVRGVEKNVLVVNTNVKKEDLNFHIHYIGVLGKFKKDRHI